MNKVLVDICRLCLEGRPNQIWLYSSNDIIKKIESLTAIKITKEDNLPKTCCESCFDNLNNSYKFQQIIIHSNTLLQEKMLSESHIIEQARDTPDLFEVFVSGEELKLKKEQLEFEHASEDEPDDTVKMLSSNNDMICTIKKEEEVQTTFVEESNENVEYKCDIKNEGTSTVVNSSNRIQTFLNNLPKFTEFEDMKIESNLSDNIENVECPDCEMKFDSKKSLQRHSVKHKVDKCPVCSVTMRIDNLKRHINIHTEGQEICEICGKIAKNKESLRGHINYQHKNKAPIKCQSCSKEFKTNHRYECHVKKVHLGIRDQQCHLCGKKYCTTRDLNKHITMTHQGARPCICQYCKKGFSSSYALKTHIRRHTLETPYHCEICFSGFRQKVSLVSHLKSKHNIITKKKEVQ